MLVSLIKMKGESVLEKRIKFHQKSVLVYRMKILLKSEPIPLIIVNIKSELWIDYKSIMYERVTLDYKDV